MPAKIGGYNFMNKTAIVTDSNSGITQAQGKELGIFVVPMPFLINGEQYYEDINLTQEQFYEKLKSDADVSTSQPIVGELLAFWDKILEEYDDMVYIPMSSGLSESCSTAKMLSKDYNGRIHVVDNQRISITQKQSVFDAKAMLKAGMSAEEIKNFLESTRLDASIYISLPTLKYLKKGGRITPAAAAMGSLLHLRPVLQIQGERLDKYRMNTVTMKSAKAAMIEGLKNDLSTRFSALAESGELAVAVAHTENFEKAEEFSKELQSVFPDVPFVACDPLSLSVACHIGPGALACAFMRKWKD